MGSDELVVVYFPQDLFQAHAIKQVLTEEGIFCYIDGEGLGLRSGDKSRTRILTKSQDSARARSIIENRDWPSYSGTIKKQEK